MLVASKLSVYSSVLPRSVKNGAILKIIIVVVDTVMFFVVVTIAFTDAIIIGVGLEAVSGPARSNSIDYI